MVNALHPPPEVIASWPKPNYIDPQTHGPGLIIITLILTILGTLIVLLRLYSRFLITKAPGIDDALIVAALLFGIALSALNIIGNKLYYDGYHVWDIPIASYVPHRINAWLGQLFFTLALCCVKISVLLFYRRLSVSFTDRFLIAVWIGIVYNILYTFGFTLTLCLLCRPLPAYWLTFSPTWVATHPHFQCGSEQIAEPLSAIFSSIGDIYSAVLPMILISRLHMPRSQKMALYFLFSLAFLVVITGFMRMVYLYRMVNVTYDFTWTLWKVWVLCQFELWIALFAASAPALKPLVKRYARQISTTVTSSRNLRMRGLGNGGAGGGGGVHGHGRAEMSGERYVEISREETEKGPGSEEMWVPESNMFYSAKVKSVLGPGADEAQGSAGVAGRSWIPTRKISTSQRHISQA